MIIGNGNAVTYKEIFPYIMNNDLWLGHKGFSGGLDFIAGNNYDESKCLHPKYDNKGNIIINVMMCVWFTNIDHKKRHEELDLYRKYNETDFPKYDNYEGIEVSKVADIPMDYEGIMGVPITFLDKYCPNQFEIIGIMTGAKSDVFTNGNDGRAKFYLNNKGVYARILIKIRK